MSACDEECCDVDEPNYGAIHEVLDDVEAERVRQHAKWGHQPLPDGCNLPGDEVMEEAARAIYESAASEGRLTHRIVLQEELAEAFNAKTPADRRKELVQCAAVIVKWIEDMDARGES